MGHSHMDMGGGGDPSVANLSLSDPACKNDNCIAFDAAHNHSQLVTPWASHFEYGHWTTWYYLIILFLAVLWRALRIWGDHRNKGNGARTERPTLRQKGLAALRYLSYRRFQGPWFHMLELLSFGVLAILLTTVLFLSLLTFVARPYYRDHTGYGSPPIAIRTGLMAFACTPILVALAGKANVVTLLTGVSHEKLNVIHQWVGWMTLVLSVIHTVPFIVAPLRDHGYTTLYQKFYGSGLDGGTMYSGVPPFAILVGLVALSIPYLRHRIYEGFYYMHVVLAITYLGLLFWHAGNTRDSWAYLWATLALWLASYLARAFWYTRPLNIQRDWLVGAPTTLSKLAGGMTRIEILGPVEFSHRPAQHCFLRFPAISLVDNHPFTIVSAPQLDEKDIEEARHDTKDGAKPRSIFFLARTHDGFTRRLADYSASQPDILASAWIDGPYGGVDRPIEQLYDQLILVAGGSGITACMPWLLHVVGRSRTGGVKVKRIVLNWVMKREEHFAWVEKELRTVSDARSQSSVVVEMRFYVTGGYNSSLSTTTPPKQPAIDEKDAGVHDVTTTQSSSPERASLSTKFIYERPSTDALLLDLAGYGTSFVFGCGPESLRTDLSNACADAQARVLRGSAQEIHMHLEAFGW